jgi:DDE superfamily endonuclease
MQTVHRESPKIHPTLFNIISKTAFNHQMYRMMKQWEISYRQKSTAVKVFQTHANVKTQFLKYYKFKVKLMNINDNDFVMPTKLTFHSSWKVPRANKSSRSAAVPGVTSNQRATVMLGCNATRVIKLTPFLVFKGASSSNGCIYQELCKRDGYPDGVELVVQEKAWFNKDVMLKWISIVWTPVMQQHINGLTLLLLDNFGVHMTAKVNSAFAKLNTELEIIPPGFTSLVQVMDVGLHKTFKDYFCAAFNGWCEGKPEHVKPH